MSSNEFIGPASALIGNGSYACDVRHPCGTEIFCDGRIVIEFPKTRIQSSLGTFLPVDAQPMAALAMKGTYGVTLDESDHLEVFEGGYIDEEHGRVSVRCHVGAGYVVPTSMRKPDGSVEFGNGSGILARNSASPSRIP